MSNNRLAIPIQNYKYILIGVITTVVGFFLMSGGGSEDPAIFLEEELFSFRRITLAPFIIMIGFGIVLYAILKKPKAEANDNNSED